MTERKQHLDALAVVSLIFCCFLWGLNQVAAKVAIAGVPPLRQAGPRSLGGAVLVFVWARLRGIALLERDGSGPGGLLAGALFAGEFGCISSACSTRRRRRSRGEDAAVAARGLRPGADRRGDRGGARWAGTLAPLTWASLAFQIVVVTFASYLLWFWLIRHYPATRLASFTLLTPVFGLLLGGWLLGEPITLRLATAAAAVGIGIVLVNRSQPRMRRTSEVVE